MVSYNNNWDINLNGINNAVDYQETWPESIGTFFMCLCDDQNDISMISVYTPNQLGELIVIEIKVPDSIFLPRIKLTAYKLWKMQDLAHQATDAVKSENKSHK